MSKSAKVWLWVATAAIVAGLILFGIVMTALGWDFTRLSTVGYVTNEYAIDEDFQNIRIDTKTADAVFLPAGDGKTQVVCKEQEKVTHSVAVDNGTLVISVTDERQWFDYVGINFGSGKITVYLPKEKYGSICVTASTGSVNCNISAAEQIKIRTTTGSINIGNLSVGALDLSVTTGKAVISDVRCKNLTTDGNTGDVVLNNVIAEGRFDIERDTGNVEFYRCDAAEIDVETDTGDVTGSLLSDKVFIVETDTGRISVPKTTTGGRCEISTDTGDIRIELADK